MWRRLQRLLILLTHKDATYFDHYVAYAAQTDIYAASTQKPYNHYHFFKTYFLLLKYFKIE